MTVTYDTDSNRATFAWADGQAVAYRFDSLDEFASVATAGNAVSVAPG